MFLQEEFRHLTVAFLGSADLQNVVSKIEQSPLPKWPTCPSGKLLDWIFLPEDNPQVVAARPIFFEEEKSLISYQQTLSQWLLDQKCFKHLTMSLVDLGGVFI